MLKLLSLALVVSVTAHALDFTRYHSQDEINAYLLQVARENPLLAVFERVGISDKGRPLNAVALTRASRVSAPVIYLNGTHHGNEKSSTETTLAFIEYVLARKDESPVKQWLEKYILFVQPIVNADGHAANTREDAFGRDPNRDYSCPGKEDGDSFKSVFIRSVRDLLDQHRVRAAIAYHSGMEGVLWPWCAKSTAADQKDIFYTLAKRAAEAMNMRLYKQSYFDYPTTGEFIDYAYMKYGTLGVTVEVSSAATPPASQLAAVVARAVKGTVAFLEGVAELDASRLVIETAPRERGTFNARWQKLGARRE